MTRPLPTLLFDSREPSLEAGDHPDALFTPWIVRDGDRAHLPLSRVTMREGDYSLPDLCLWKPIDDDGPWRGRPLVVIERKTCADAISTVIGTTTNALGERCDNRDRFAAELERMRDYAFRCIVIESVPEMVQRAASEPGRRFNALSVLGSYAAFAPRFGVQVWWAGNRAGAEWYVGTTLARIWEEHVGGPAWKKAVQRGDVAHLPWAKRAEQTVTEDGT